MTDFPCFLILWMQGRYDESEEITYGNLISKTPGICFCSFNAE